MQPPAHANKRSEKEKQTEHGERKIRKKEEETSSRSETSTADDSEDESGSDEGEESDSEESSSPEEFAEGQQMEQEKQKRKVKITRKALLSRPLTPTSFSFSSSSPPSSSTNLVPDHQRERFSDPSLPPFIPARYDPNATWGSSAKKISEIRSQADQAYEKMPFWRRNLFVCPSGAVGKEAVKILAGLFNAWTRKGPFELIALKLAILFPPLMFQKAPKMQAPAIKTVLQERLEKWKQGRLDDLVEEVEQIQKRMTSTWQKSPPEHNSRVFARLMLQGKVRSALKYATNTTGGGVAPPTPEVLQKLKEKHHQMHPSLPRPCSKEPFTRFPHACSSRLMEI